MALNPPGEMRNKNGRRTLTPGLKLGPGNKGVENKENSAFRLTAQGEAGSPSQPRAEQTPVG